MGETSRDELGKALIAAANLLHEFVAEKLPDCYSIELRLQRGESEIMLFGPNGNSIDAQDGDDAVVRELVNHARELEGMEPV